MQMQPGRPGPPRLVQEMRWLLGNPNDSLSEGDQIIPVEEDFSKTR